MNKTTKFKVIFRLYSNLTIYKRAELGLMHLSLFSPWGGGRGAGDPGDFDNTMKPQRGEFDFGVCFIAGFSHLEGRFDLFQNLITIFFIVLGIKIKKVYPSSCIPPSWICVKSQPE
jgi:hypothetical protein